MSKEKRCFFEYYGKLAPLDYLNLLSDDGIHPNEKGHRKIYEKVKPLFT